MRILIIDNDEYARQRLSEMLGKLAAGASLKVISGAEEFYALKDKANFDAAFLETELSSVSSIELAMEIRIASPRCNIIFVTGRPGNSLEAFRARPSGFVLKPFSEKDIRRELDDLRYPIVTVKEHKLRVVTFGSFAVYVNGEAMKFSRTISKEVFAYLIDQYGFPITSRDIAADVFGEKNYDEGTSKKVSKAVGHLMSDLRNIGFADVVDKQNRQLRIDKRRLYCDLYDALDGSEAALAAFNGEYLIDYSWAESSYAASSLREKQLMAGMV